MHLKNKMVDPSLSPLSIFPVGDLHKAASFLFCCLSNGSFLGFCNNKDMLSVIIPMSGHIPSDPHLLVEFAKPLYEINSEQVKIYLRDKLLHIQVDESVDKADNIVINLLAICEGKCFLLDVIFLE
jgi:hypothetical protein